MNDLHDKDPISVLIDRLVASYTKRAQGNMPDSEWVTKEILTNYRDIVENWMEARVHEIVKQRVTKRLGAVRGVAIRRVQRQDYSAMTPQVLMSTPFYVPNVGWKTVGRMTGTDHVAVAQAYERIENTSQRRAILHRSLAEEIGNATTEEKFKPDQLIARLRHAYVEETLTPISQIASP